MEFVNNKISKTLFEFIIKLIKNHHETRKVDRNGCSSWHYDLD